MKVVNIMVQFLVDDSVEPDDLAMPIRDNLTTNMDWPETVDSVEVYVCNTQPYTKDGDPA